MKPNLPPPTTAAAGTHTSYNQESESSLTISSELCRQFTFSEIELATQNFNEYLVIGHGGFGKVYRGIINVGETSVFVAVKRLESTSNQGAEEFWAEVGMLSLLRHSNLVSLIGYCNDGQEMILLYDYMPYGTLGDRLYKGHAPLTWVQRLEICIGAACGLEYLHTGTEIKPRVIHSDVKSSNILLDNNWAARISDFGLSKIRPLDQASTYSTKMVRGTFGYLDPNYFQTGRLTRKSDVYAFGIVLFEVICGKSAVITSHDEEQQGFATWIQDSIREGRLTQIIDHTLKRSITPKCLKQFARLANQCLHSDPKQRPTMAQVVVGLESILALHEKSNKASKLMDMTIFGRKLSTFLFSSNKESSGSSLEVMVNKESEQPPQLPLKTSVSVSRTREGERNKLVFFDGGIYNFDLEDLLRGSTEVLGRGSVGTSFNVFLEEGTTMVVKRLRDVVVTKKKFESTMEVVGKMKNKNVVTLIAFYYSKDEKLLVYDYFPAGSLSALLHGSRGSFRTSFDWGHRMIVALSAAKGLEYLHRAGKVVHGNIKSSNILLQQDASKGASVSDFGLTKLFDNPSSLNHRVTGYWAPEVLKNREVSFMSDVYSFGVVLLELLTGKAPNQSSLGEEGIDLPRWVQSVVREEWTAEVFDVELMRYQNIEEEMIQLLQIAIACVSSVPDQRPSMKEVVRMMEEINRVETNSR